MTKKDEVAGALFDIANAISSIGAAPDGLEDIADAIRGHGNDVREAAGLLADAITNNEKGDGKDAS
jgi:hypothetical protein